MTSIGWQRITLASSGPSSIFFMTCFMEHRHWVPVWLFPALTIISFSILATSIVMQVINRKRENNKFSST